MKHRIANTTLLAEQYGVVLAALSGEDENNGGIRQTKIDALVDGITITDTTAALNAS